MVERARAHNLLLFFSSLWFVAVIVSSYYRLLHANSALVPYVVLHKLLSVFLWHITSLIEDYKLNVHVVLINILVVMDADFSDAPLASGNSHHTAVFPAAIFSYR
jgi:hypothetical protein